MGRSTSYLSNARHVVYFNYPTFETEENESIPEDISIVIEDIQQLIISEFPEFEEADKWDGRENRIILEGYSTQIGFSDYYGLSTLSIRVDESIFEYADNDDMANKWRENAEKWIDENWERISQPWNQFRKLGTFSNGESAFEYVKG